MAPNLWTRSPTFRSIWIAHLASNFGGLIQTVGAAWMMTALGASSQLIALVQTATALPIVLISLLAGALAQELARPIVLVCAHIDDADEDGLDDALVGFLAVAITGETDRHGGGDVDFGLDSGG